MSSLQDQLLKAGLADKGKASKIKQEKRKKAKINRKHKIQELDENKQAAAQVLAQKQAKDRALNAQSHAEAEKKAIVAQIVQLIERNKQPKNNGEVACNFTDGSLVKRLVVNESTNKHISQGKLAIVKHGEQYEIVPMPVADKIAERDPSLVVHRADQAEIDATTASMTEEEKDWYADYDIPDDLTW